MKNRSTSKFVIAVLIALLLGFLFIGGSEDPKDRPTQAIASFNTPSVIRATSTMVAPERHPEFGDFVVTWFVIESGYEHFSEPFENVSPDGLHAVHVLYPGSSCRGGDIRIQNLTDQTQRRIELPNAQIEPVWSDDSLWIGFLSTQDINGICHGNGDTYDLYAMRAEYPWDLTLIETDIEVSNDMNEHHSIFENWWNKNHSSQ